jgi:hypothetical protein
MSEFARNVRIETRQGDDMLTYHLFINDQEFPWYTVRGGLSVEPSEYKNFTVLNVKILVDNPVVELPEGYGQDENEDS